ncbi:hypothetical protein [Adlercreutzia sp. ZJ154]|uniref:hypothetical protein n=1 Tax=Adlercreutzia sp. ZJ154 TaxID=2709790 RepID=UPI0013ED4DD9|nr:hypothetical protein [Adlercreutzia sp. ZJ154]
MKKSELDSDEKRRVAAKAHGSSKKSAKRDLYLRAANEDDDGYDPYSDRPYIEPFYEPDPWD